MGWRASEDPDEFDAAAGTFLRGRPVEHTILLTVLEGVRRGVTYGPGVRPRFGWWCAPDGAVAGAFLHTPPHPVVTTAMPDSAVVTLVDLLADGPRAVYAVAFDHDRAAGFAQVWRTRTGTDPTVSLRLRLHLLADLQRPQPPPAGRARPAGPADRDLLLAWHHGFARDIGQPPEQATSTLDDRLDNGGFTLWEDGSTPVSLVGTTRPAAGVVRVAPVYTPPEHRCRGYAAAATSAASEAALDTGASAVVLFTDLDNPTSNALYHRLGFRPVADRVVLTVDQPDPPDR